MRLHASKSQILHCSGKVACILLFLCVASSLSEAGDLKIHGIWPVSSTKSPSSIDRLYVVFETPVDTAAADVRFHCGFASDTKSINPWHVMLYDKSGTPTSLDHEIVKACADEKLFTTRGSVTLELAQPLPEYSRVDVTFGGANIPYASLVRGVTPKSPVVEAAKTRNDADVYVSGTVTPSVGAGPSYNIDSTLKYTLRQWGENALFAAGQVKTDNRPTADPDSFSWNVGYRRTGLRGSMFEWDFAGMQMDKKANALNFYSAPKFVWNVQRLFKGMEKTKKTGQTYLTPNVLVGLDLTLGMEFGDNFRDDFTVTNNKGLGGFARGVPGAAAYVVVPHVLHFKKITLASTYTARIPTADELFLETRHTSKPVPMLTSNTRHYLQDDLQFMFSDYVGFEIKQQYGSLPPAFSFVDNRVSIGLVLQLKQDKVPQ
jgi:hypothetical protein